MENGHALPCGVGPTRPKPTTITGVPYIHAAPHADGTSVASSNRNGSRPMPGDRTAANLDAAANPDAARVASEAGVGGDPATLNAAHGTTTAAGAAATNLSGRTTPPSPYRSARSALRNRSAAWSRDLDAACATHS